MATRRDLRQLSSCRKKVRYGSRYAAELGLEHFSKKKNDYTMKVYFCKWCKGFHIGHTSINYFMGASRKRAW